MTRTAALRLVAPGFEADAFYKDLEARQRSPRTADFYREAIDQFRAFLQATGRSSAPADLTAAHFLAFYEHLWTTPDRRTGKRRLSSPMRHPGVRITEAASPLWSAG